MKFFYLLKAKKKIAWMDNEVIFICFNLSHGFKFTVFT